MRPLAFFTPLPPSTSGIAQYSAELLPNLLQHYAITAVLADDAPSPTALPAGLAIARGGRYTAPALRVYQLGNSPQHAYILAQAERAPGILVLHDVVLQHLQVWRALHGGAAAALVYRAEMARRYGTVGAAAAEDLLHNRTPALPYAHVPLSETLVERSQATIVHSRYARDEMLRRCPGADVTVVPHGVPLLPSSSRAAARAALGLPQGALVVAALGNLIPEKRLEVALSAFARALYGVQEAVFVVAGAGSSHYDPRIFARRHGLEPVTRWLGRVDAPTFENVLAAADLCVNLRWPTGGETSGSFLRMLAAGRATLVSDVGSFAEIPDDACVKIPLGAGEETAITEAIIRAAQEPDWVGQIGTRARAFVAREQSFARAATGYRATIERIAAHTA